MGGQREESAQTREGRLSQGYEPPRVEQVLTLADLEREILYAGAVDGSNPG
jgi:hypothetical protein